MNLDFFKFIKMIDILRPDFDWRQQASGISQVEFLTNVIVI